MSVELLVILILLVHCAGIVASGACIDEHKEEYCIELRSKNFCNSPQSATRSIMREKCAASCGYCSPTGSACEDTNSDCATYKSFGLCNNIERSEFEEVLATQCRKTCGICEETRGCEDVFTESQCRKLADDGMCKDKPYFMSNQCPRTCEFCHDATFADEASTVVTLGWSEWGPWSICDVVCGEGLRYRYRSCLGGTCFGRVNDEEPCTVTNCPKEVCHEEEETYCPFWEELEFCTREESKGFMKENCPISCEDCTELNRELVGVVTAPYKLCVDRVLNTVVTNSLTKHLQVNNKTKEDIIQESRLPIESQESLRKLSTQGRALTIQDNLFNEIVSQVNSKCGVDSQGTRGYIETKLMEAKLITINHLNCTEQCGSHVGHVYRHINGTCNNCDSPLLGSTTTTVHRLLGAEYENMNRSEPRGWAQHVRGAAVRKDVPSPRLVTKLLLDGDTINDARLTLMHFQWGQFLDHDLVLVPTHPESTLSGGSVDCKKECSNRHPCFPIQLEESDPLTNVSSGRRKCLPFTRSAGIKFDVKGAYPYTNQLNEVTSFLDASTVYGSNDFLGLLLKGPTGTMRTSGPCPALDEGPLLPECPRSSADIFCSCDLEFCPEKYIAGDARVNEQPMLTLMHTMWVREHNRIAGILADINQCWDSEKIFEETRKIVIAMMQHITYRLYLPILLGPAGYKHYIGFESRYNPLLNVGIFNSFAAAAFRFGHSQIPSNIPLFDKDWNPLKPEVLHGSFFRANKLCALGYDNMLRGLVHSPGMHVDQHFTDSIREHLFSQHLEEMGLDLTSINVQRGRDHGIPPYARYRDYCQEKYMLKAKFRDEQATRDKINHLFKGDMDQLDLFVGGILEEPVNDGLLGPTFSCIIGEQFRNLREGDRFFYTHQGVFTAGQLREIFKSSLSKVTCDNSVTIDKVPRRAFINQDVSEFVKCSSLPEINLEKWRECPRLEP